MDVIGCMVFVIASLGLFLLLFNWILDLIFTDSDDNDAPPEG